MVFETPVLFLIFNRPDATRLVWQEIQILKPARLFIAADGPTPNKENEKAACLEVKDIVSNIHWPCNVRTLYREEHLGCKMAVSSAIDWFFSKVEYGIILEDDCLPSISFFTFCEAMLIQFKNHPDIMHITGNNFQHHHTRGDGSYYFSKYSHIWGWATWKRAWSTYSLDLCEWDHFSQTNDFTNLFNSKRELRYWMRKFNRYRLSRNVQNYWSLQWQYACWYSGGKAIIPQQNLVTNIGIGSGTNMTIKLKHLEIDRKMFPAPYLNPTNDRIDRAADYYTFKTIFYYKGSLWSRIQHRFNRWKKLMN
ncbi:MAG: hypothetical protein ABI844_19580 [Saprospiraceae bacterium]